MRISDWSSDVCSSDLLTFDLRNLNDKAHPTRRWTARFTAKGVKLSGDIWYAHVEQDGRRGGVKDAEARAFDFAPDLPPLGRIAPDNLAATPPMGWSSWNKFGDKIDDADRKSTRLNSSH